MDAFAQKYKVATDAEKLEAVSVWEDDMQGILPSHTLAFLGREERVLPETLQIFEELLPSSFWTKSSFNGSTPLQTACKYCNLPVVAIIMRQVRAQEVVEYITQGAQRMSSVSLACEFGTKEMVAFLMDAIPKDAKLAGRRGEWSEALAIAVKQGKEEMFHSVFERTPIDSVYYPLGEEGEHTVLELTATKGILSALKSQLHRLTSTEDAHRDAVMSAIRIVLTQGGDIKILEELVDWVPACHIAQPDERGQTVLHLAARSQSPEFARLMMARVPAYARHIPDSNGILAEELADGPMRAAFQPIVKGAIS